MAVALLALLACSVEHASAKKASDKDGGIKMEDIEGMMKNLGGDKMMEALGGLGKTGGKGKAGGSKKGNDGLDLAAMAQMAAGLMGGAGGGGGGMDVEGLAKMASGLLGGAGGAGGAGGLNTDAIGKLAGSLLGGGGKGLDTGSLLEMAASAFSGQEGPNGVDMGKIASLAANIINAEDGMKLTEIVKKAGPAMGVEGEQLDEVVEAVAEIGDDADITTLMEQATDALGKGEPLPKGIDKLVEMVGGQEGIEALQALTKAGGMDGMMSNVETMVKHLENDPRVAQAYQKLDKFMQDILKTVDPEKIFNRMGGAAGLMSIVTSFDMIKISKLMAAGTKAYKDFLGLVELVQKSFPTEKITGELMNAFGGADNLEDMAISVMGEDGQPNVMKLLMNEQFMGAITGMFLNKNFIGDLIEMMTNEIPFDTITSKLAGIAESVEDAVSNKPKRKPKRKPKQIKASPDLSKFAALVDKLGGLDKVVDMMNEMGMADMLKEAGGKDALRELVKKQKKAKGDKHDEL